MNNQIIEDSSSSQTPTNSEPSPSRQIVLDVYYTSIYKHPTQLKSQHHLISKTLFIFRDSYLLAHKENSKVKIAYRSKEILKLLRNGFEIIAQVRFQKTPQGDYAFTIERNLCPQKCHPFLKDDLEAESHQSRSKDPNAMVYVSTKNQQDFSQSQLIKNNGFIKMGKEIYETKIIPQNSSAQTVRLLHSDPNNRLILDSKESSMECKICLFNQGQSQKDYIVSPCKCSGSCSAVHVQCLKNWISQKIQVGKGDLKLRTYDMEQFACEICKQKYPQLIQVQNSFVDMTPQMKINSDTLILTKVYPVPEDKKYSHFISLDKGKVLAIGRHYSNELILEDMSISRFHSSIYRSKNDKRFYIHDKNSRFGTFTNLESPIHNLKGINLVSQRHTFVLKVVDDKKAQPSSGDEMTEEKIDY